MSADNRETQKQVAADLDKKIEANKVFVFDFDGTITVLEGYLSHCQWDKLKSKESVQVLIKNILGNDDMGNKLYKHLMSKDCTIKDLRLNTINETPEDQFFTKEMKEALLNKLVRQDIVKFIKAIHDNSQGVVYITSYSSESTLQTSLNIIGLEVGSNKAIQAINCPRYSRPTRVEQVNTMLNTHDNLIDPPQFICGGSGTDSDLQDFSDYDDNFSTTVTIDNPDDLQTVKRDLKDVDVIFVDDSDKNHKGMLSASKTKGKVNSIVQIQPYANNNDLQTNKALMVVLNKTLKGNLSESFYSKDTIVELGVKSKPKLQKTVSFTLINYQDDKRNLVFDNDESIFSVIEKSNTLKAKYNNKFFSEQDSSNDDTQKQSLGMGK